ncbi:MAG TPA: hypothetical protein PLK99_08240, partial [Burkholderiales bacterium]|nr:hypothetical protein [Burkholderiales bacterium]
DARTRWCDFPPLVVTATDGDNGGWFRNPEYSANFWGFYKNLLDQARSSRAGIKPVFMDDYLDRFGAKGKVHVETGAWNTGWHHGHGFLQWTGSQSQKDALNRVAEVSAIVHEAGKEGCPVEGAMWRLLRAETSCNFFWGEDWVHRAHRDLDESLAWLGSRHSR